MWFIDEQTCTRWVKTFADNRAEEDIANSRGKLHHTHTLR